MRKEQSQEKKLELEPECREFFHEVLMPSEIVTSVKQGKKTARVRKLYPGYLFVRMNIYDEDNPKELNAKAYYFIGITPLPESYFFIGMGGVLGKRTN